MSRSQAFARFLSNQPFIAPLCAVFPAFEEELCILSVGGALERIENGTYGLCESCGEDITPQRLKARPVTTQCIDCKIKEEALEKALGL